MLLSINVLFHRELSIFHRKRAGRPQMDSLIAALSGAFVPDTKLCLFAFPVDRLLQGALSSADSRIEDEDW